MADNEARKSRETRVPWPDRWLLDALRQQSHPAVERLGAAPTAWESAEAAGATTAELLAIVCGLSGARPADLSGVDPSLAKLLSPTLAIRYGVVPVRITGGILEVATANPLSMHLERDLAFASGRRVALTVAPPSAMRRAQESIYGPNVAKTVATRIEWIFPDGSAGTRPAPGRGAVVDTLDRLIADAVDQGASDLHFEPKDDELLVRFRVDGVLHEVTRVASDLAPLLMSRLKVVAGLDIADRRRPQDGRASMRIDGRVVDLRVSTLPLNDRIEKGVVRLLDSRAGGGSLDSLGFLPSEAHRVNQLLSQSEGVVLVTGPTGSGKTTTLYSAIMHVKSEGTNIVTVEDPIEYRLEGISQVQVNERAGVSFASSLRSILRQDPDVILVGEVRDRETADIAVKAGLTGHLVLTTLHTIDAPAAIARLADMGLDMSAVSGALKGVIAQRLVRRLCDACALPTQLSELPTTQQALLIGRSTDKLRRGVGCKACRGTGYRGRMVVAEVLVATDELRSAIARKADRVELGEVAKRAGMLTMWEAGVRRVLEGGTTIAELLDNVPTPIAEAGAGQSDVDALLAKLLGGTGPAPLAAAAAVKPPAPRASTGVPAPAGALRILVAHDDRVTRQALRVALEDAGFAVLEAADGEAALSTAKRLKPNLVVTELVLPRLDGYSLAQALSSEHGIGAIAYTVETDAGAHEWARDVGCRAIVGAAEGPSSLVGAVREALAAAT